MLSSLDVFLATRRYRSKPDVPSVSFPVRLHIDVTLEVLQRRFKIAFGSRVVAPLNIDICEVVSDVSHLGLDTEDALIALFLRLPVCVSDEWQYSEHQNYRDRHYSGGLTRFNDY